MTSAISARTVGGASSAVLQVSGNFGFVSFSALTPFPTSFRFLRDHRLFDVPLTPVAFSLPLIQGFLTPITVLSARAWRRTVMAVQRSSTLVPVEQIYSMNGVGSVRLHSFPQLGNIYLTVFQGSRRVER